MQKGKTMRFQFLASCYTILCLAICSLDQNLRWCRRGVRSGFRSPEDDCTDESGAVGPGTGNTAAERLEKFRGKSAILDRSI